MLRTRAMQRLRVPRAKPSPRRSFKPLFAKRSKHSRVTWTTPRLRPDEETPLKASPCGHRLTSSHSDAEMMPSQTLYYQTHAELLVNQTWYFTQASPFKLRSASEHATDDKDILGKRRRPSQFCYLMLHFFFFFTHSRLFFSSQGRERSRRRGRL